VSSQYGREGEGGGGGPAAGRAPRAPRSAHRSFERSTRARCRRRARSRPGTRTCSQAAPRGCSPRRGCAGRAPRAAVSGAGGEWGSVRSSLFVVLCLFAVLCSLFAVRCSLFSRAFLFASSLSLREGSGIRSQNPPVHAESHFKREACLHECVPNSHSLKYSHGDAAVPAPTWCGGQRHTNPPSVFSHVAPMPQSFQNCAGSPTARASHSSASTHVVGGSSGRRRYPAGHSHVKEPCVLLHTATPSQSSIPTRHSSTSSQRSVGSTAFAGSSSLRVVHELSRHGCMRDADRACAGAMWLRFSFALCLTFVSRCRTHCLDPDAPGSVVAPSGRGGRGGARDGPVVDARRKARRLLAAVGVQRAPALGVPARAAAPQSLSGSLTGC
jgi:hypothetical protein